MWEFHSSYRRARLCWSWKFYDCGRLHRFSDSIFGSITEAIGDASLYGFEMQCHRWAVFDARREDALPARGGALPGAAVWREPPAPRDQPSLRPRRLLQ